MGVRTGILPVTESKAKGLYLNHAQLALGQIHQLDLLDSNGLAGAPIERLVDSSERALAYTLSQALSRSERALVSIFILYTPMCISHSGTRRPWRLETHVVLQPGIL